MKITDYQIVEASDRASLVKAVKAQIEDRWEILGVPQVRDFWFQPMVKRYDPHEGQVWFKVPGKRGQWMTPEAAAAARLSES